MGERTSASLERLPRRLQLEILHVCGWFDYGKVQLHAGEIVAYGLVWAVMFLCVGTNEEGTLRGYVQRVTTDGLSVLPGSWSFWASAVLFSMLFDPGHLSNPCKFNVCPRVIWVSSDCRLRTQLQRNINFRNSPVARFNCNAPK